MTTGAVARQDQDDDQQDDGDPDDREHRHPRRPARVRPGVGLVAGVVVNGRIFHVVSLRP
jgi:hypothetical protein